ncbi:uncharacterized protein BCR38DRAFT_453639 [Pseudomassariella vexata]|uniref:Uncharacterized protein n=1 Tax=Pseudomassariella vexata TaxID=1141098 RepID=A0A1Y2EHC5_9PEZI|nr:uncharacterized protein BCR38DRAFT_453639 [Pseudomassariella vexata]ORY70972.1 hypothetical protein BCR38DRAFT_453639 [Pseudomassariella vexata]
MGLSNPPLLALSAVALVLGLGFFLTSKLLTRRRPIPVPVNEKPDPFPSSIVFPPSRRHTLARLLPSSKIATKQNVIPPHELRRKQLTTTKVQDLDKPDQYTPTGFSTQEIKAMGRFPDYSVLSGVAHPQPSHSFDISKATFRPFRPLRWTYHQTMALMKLETDYWLELEHNYHRRMKQRLALLEEHGEKVLFWCPGSELASRELMEMVVQFLCIRYPHYFQLEQNNTVLRNRLLDTVTEIPSMHPLQVLFNNVPEDFAVMCRNEEDGLYYLRSAMICSSVGWNIGLHKNKVLRRIHDNVPQWEEKMAFSVDRWFTKLPVDRPGQRCSWGIEDWEAFFCPETHPRSAFAHDPSSCTVNDLQLRCDWQTLRRLPISGSIIFNFKAVFTPFTQLKDEPYVPRLMHTIITRTSRDLITYKMEEHVEKIAVEALESWARKQEEDGVVPRDWEVGTLEEHPYFPGWNKKEEGMPVCPVLA